MKNVLKTWKWSLGLVARSPQAVAALTVVLAAVLYAAYRWLYFPMESAVYLMALGSLWALILFGVLATWMAVSVAAISDASAADARRIEWRSLVRFNRSERLRAAGFLILACLVVAAAWSLFAWIDSYSLEVASWFTFKSEKPMAQESVEAVLVWIERILWVAILGFLVSFLIALQREGWRGAFRLIPRLIANCCWRSSFLTSLVSLLVFGGVAYGLVTWHPKVTPGYMDFAQVIVRNAVALAVAVAGWAFWVLSLTRQGQRAPSSPAPTSVS